MKLICKKSKIECGIYSFEKNQTYNIHLYSRFYYQVNKTTYININELYEYFYSELELRELKLKKILK